MVGDKRLIPIKRSKDIRLTKVVELFQLMVTMDMLWLKIKHQ